MDGQRFDVIVACDADRGIGRDGDLPWHLPGDLAYFKDITSRTTSPSMRNVVIMGRRTWDSIPLRYRPLDGRYNIVLTRNPQLILPTGVGLANRLSDALALADEQSDGAEVFVVGGAQIYQMALAHPGCNRVYVTELEERFDCDTFFPKLGADYVECSRSERREDAGVGYSFVVYERAHSSPPQSA